MYKWRTLRDLPSIWEQLEFLLNKTQQFMWQLGWSWFLTNKRTSLLIPGFFCSICFFLSFSFSQPNAQTYPEKPVLFPAGCISVERVCGPLPFQACLTLPCNQMFHWRTYTWESLGCIQLLVNSLPQSNGCKQNQPKKNKTFSKLSWPRTELSPEMQMSVSMLMRLQREAHLPSLIFKGGFHLAEGLGWGFFNNFCSPDFQGFGDTRHRDRFQCCPRCIMLFAAVHVFGWVSGQEYLESGHLLAWKSQKN